MWTKQYLRNFEETMERLVFTNKIKSRHRDKIIEIARSNSDLGYEKYKSCFQCSKINSKECNMKVCYSVFRWRNTKVI